MWSWAPKFYSCDHEARFNSSPQGLAAPVSLFYVLLSSYSVHIWLLGSTTNIRTFSIVSKLTAPSNVIDNSTIGIHWNDWMNFKDFTEDMNDKKRCHKVFAIIGCNGSKKRMFTFPCLLKDKDRCLQWITLSRKEDFLQLLPKVVRNKVLYDIHFENRYRFTKNHTRDALPTCNLPAPAASAKPQEETGMEIKEEEEHKFLISIHMIK
ncbi:uncharacterized protein LOC128873318 isoform X1 [Hylaeus volcanicus]|uniref:uncharacterized protein LOC128873318 isoform X1 n=1 Tax=Hylaeus volcanicus TaxID=313075 RepID=UPI0023B7804B|nr:uncharacterized protein LOC128873318 isoform X1 [Hylaeus volcanicus]